jgi:hypothetical protein
MTHHFFFLWLLPALLFWSLTEKLWVLASIVDQDSGSNLIYSSAITTDAAGQTINEILAPSATDGLAYEPKPFSATYDADNRLATFNKAPVRYDLDGNLVRGPSPGDREAAFLYHACNQLSEGDGVSYAYANVSDSLDVACQVLGIKKTD